MLQLLAWSAAGVGGYQRYPPYEDVPGLILRDVPIAEVVAALPEPLRVRVREAGAARGYELPKWAELLLRRA
ncbi:hypothetical protein OG205_35800 [Lentzea sp. NBC_00516]|uniref:hypothetical protein n=1 Tax=Lentzea sp. NBC_00516 TaxID=2903582 RepID=UPI002E80C391|nr:hypothetical protein [Lentzea sp. NBC_00516]WUD23381.1 hypothetical protein OG205_35800 [Lentzea sp. NBC_00516]